MASPCQDSKTLAWDVAVIYLSFGCVVCLCLFSRCICWIGRLHKMWKVCQSAQLLHFPANSIWTFGNSQLVSRWHSQLVDTLNSSVVDTLNSSVVDTLNSLTLSTRQSLTLSTRWHSQLVSRWHSQLVDTLNSSVVALISALGRKISTKSNDLRASSALL